MSEGLPIPRNPHDSGTYDCIEQEGSNEDTNSTTKNIEPGVGTLTIGSRPADDEEHHEREIQPTDEPALPVEELPAPEIWNR